MEQPQPQRELTIGEILVLHAEYESSARNERLSQGARNRAAHTAQCLDELIERRRKDAPDAR